MKKSKTSLYTQREVEMAVQEARRAGIREGRILARNSEDKRERHIAFYEASEKMLLEKVEGLRRLSRVSGRSLEEVKLMKWAATVLISKLRMKAGEKP